MPYRYDALREKLNRYRTELLLSGPMALSDFQRQLDVPPGTIDRHLDILLKEKEIIPYATELQRTKRVKTTYGFTLYGFLRSFRIRGRAAKKNFRKVMETWLPEGKFNFFLPKDEVREALKEEDVVTQLAKFCQMISDMFPEAEDLSDFFEEEGYSESSPSRIIGFAMQLVGRRRSREWIELSKVLCRHLPSYREEVRHFIQAQRSRLDSMERQILGTTEEENA